ncbi:thrombospondin type 3 repeat-containing protein [Paraliomyxa miuraensis]|nr:thrombospondin type 3 repeat-containing protein [Paraliomyxa miuraensis]
MLLSLLAIALGACDWFPPEEPEPCETSTETDHGTTAGTSSDTGTASTSDTDASSGGTSGPGSSSSSDTGEASGMSSGGGDVDSDGDGILDANDNCPFDANVTQDNGDADAWGDACDSCPFSPGIGGAPDDSCCDPRSAASCVEPPFAAQTLVCRLDDPGTRFTCNYHVLGCSTSYGYMCDCPLESPCLPDESLVPPNFLGSVQCLDGGDSCQTKWCTIGGDPNQCREYVSGIWNQGSPNQPTCMPFFAPGTAPGGLEDLGVCMRNAGPCSGLLGSECATWGT